jgi:serine/threonine-protein kinase
MPPPDNDKPPAELAAGPASPSPLGDSTMGAEPQATALAPTLASGGRQAQAQSSGGERYELLEVLGQGGMGEVHKAWDRRLGRTVALKFIRGENPERAMRFLQEARAQARIDHPNICKVFDAGEVGGKAYIAMQLVGGQRLDQAATAMSLPERVQVMSQVALAIHEAHRLGIIHRDIKPSNIMVERGEDGRLFPVVMDFGLAYEVTQGHGLTETGALLGTPSYMAPEQARGDVRSIDRRSDVYSLGATLYELLAGVAPFTDATLVGTLSKVLHEEPLPLRSRVPHLASDLETIVLKCLAKEPDRRYPSARALAEDLGRYIDGEPILGRRPSVLYRLSRRARKNRVLVAVSAASLVSILVLAVFGVRSWLEARHTQQQAAGRALLAERLGQQAKELEWFLRLAHALPLHDTGREQQLVRERMARIAAQPHELGAHGQAIIHYALGRGHLALHEYEKAGEQLELARNKGLDSPELHYARGRILGELYRQGMEEARRSGDKQWVASQQAALEKQLLQPALESLARSQELELESPRYVEGLIALYQRRYDDAARAASQAVSQTPWLAEAQRLAGDVAFTRAMEQFDSDRSAAHQGLLEAARLYTRAVESAPSDSRNHEALAEVWLQLAELDERESRPEKPALEQVLAASQKSLKADPLRSRGYTQKAYGLMNLYRIVRFQEGKQESKQVLDEWLATASRALELNPRDIHAHDALGNAYFMLGLHEARNGGDPEPAWQQAIAALSKALDIQPHYPWALNDLGRIHRWRGDYLREHGKDPLAQYAQAARHYEEAVRLDPAYLYPYTNMAALYGAMAEHRLMRGLDPSAEVRKAVLAGERALELDSQYHLALNNMALAELSHAQYLLELGADPRAPLEQAQRHLERSLGIKANLGRTYLYQSVGHHLTALHALRERGNPSASLEAGRRALENASRYEPQNQCADCSIMKARMSLAAAQWGQQQGKESLPLLQQALTEARRAVAVYPYFESHLEQARACWRLAQVQPPGQALATTSEGLAQVEQALKLMPELPHAHALQGGLLLIRSRAVEKAPERLPTARQAQQALARAFELNPLLRREYEELAREVETLLSQAEAGASLPR